MNPKLKKFIEENPDVTMLGFAWALYWRVLLVVTLVYLAAGLLTGFSFLNY